MKNLGTITDPLDIVTKEYVDSLATGGGVPDSGWIFPILASGWVQYASDTTKVRYRRVGNIVYVQGQVKPTASMALNATDKTIFTLPEGYRPVNDILRTCQGSGTTVWALRITADGLVQAARARDMGNANGVYNTIPATYWMPFATVFVTDETSVETTEGITEYDQGDWHIKKYANGWAECWYRKNIGQVTLLNALGTDRVSNSITVDFPFEFAEIPYCQIAK